MVSWAEDIMLTLFIIVGPVFCSFNIMAGL